MRTAAPLFLALCVSAGSRPEAVCENGTPVVFDCTHGSTCTQLARNESMKPEQGFIFFLVYAKGIIHPGKHDVVLKIRSTEIPGALNHIEPAGRNTHRLRFVVDTEKFRVSDIRPHEIHIWIDGTEITP